jgi:hypothetical protein
MVHMVLDTMHNVVHTATRFRIKPDCIARRGTMKIEGVGIKRSGPPRFRDLDPGEAFRLFGGDRLHLVLDNGQSVGLDTGETYQIHLDAFVTRVNAKVVVER